MLCCTAPWVGAWRTRFSALRPSVRVAPRSCLQAAREHRQPHPGQEGQEEAAGESCLCGARVEQARRSTRRHANRATAMESDGATPEVHGSVSAPGMGRANCIRYSFGRRSAAERCPAMPTRCPPCAPPWWVQRENKLLRAGFEGRKDGFIETPKRPA